MKYSEIKILVEDHRSEIIEALRKADRSAYYNCNCKYSVALFPDGHTEIRERLAGDDWWYENDPAVLELGGFCYEYYDVIRDNFCGSDEVLKELVSAMTPEEKAKYDEYLVEFDREQKEFWEDDDIYKPDAYDATKWIEENLGVWYRLRNMVIDELTESSDAEDGYEQEIDYNLDALERIERM